MEPRGFWSYARGDDEHLDSILTQLRKRVAGEVSMLFGHDVDIFQDIRDLRTGDRWEETLREQVTAASFLIPVLTPRYFNRDWCREETLTFLRVAREKGVEPRIFPIRFVPFDPDEDDELRAALAAFQYKDFSTWRFENDPTRREKLLYEFAKDVKARLKAATPAPRPAAASSAAARSEVASSAPKEAVATPGRGEREAPERPPEEPKYQTFTVDPMPGRGDFTSISAAIAKAQAGSRVLVRPGTYRESLRLSKPLELAGQGDRERIVVIATEGNALRCDASMARVTGMTFRREAGGKSYGVWITDGAAELEDCVIESRSFACVTIEGSGTVPTLRRCVMQDGPNGGLLVLGGARPVVEDCELSRNSLAGGIVSGEGTWPTLRRCVARDGKNSGFYLSEDAGGLLERCQAIGNAHNGVEITGGANPLLSECTIRENRFSGAHVYEAGRGRLEGCTIEQNGTAGITVKTGGAPVVTGCTLRGNGYHGVWIVDRASGGTFENNDLRGNANGAWNVAEGAEAKLVRRGNKE